MVSESPAQAVAKGEEHPAGAVEPNWKPELKRTQMMQSKGSTFRGTAGKRKAKDRSGRGKQSNQPLTFSTLQLNMKTFFCS